MLPIDELELRVSEKDLPVHQDETGDTELAALDVLVDGYVAQAYIYHPTHRGSKIVIEFASPHPRWKRSFRTKYYDFIEPGVMLWGHDEETMRIVRRTRSA